MSKKNHSIDKQIDVILKTLYALKDDGRFYFETYGKDMIKTLLKDNKNKIMETITVTKRSTNNEIRKAILQLESELKIRTTPIEIDINIIDVIMKKFIADYWQHSSIGIPDTKSWLKMNFNITD